MAEPITIVLGGVVVAVVSGTVGKSWGQYKKVCDKICSERMTALQTLIITKLDNLEKLIATINDKS